MGDWRKRTGAAGIVALAFGLLVVSVGMGRDPSSGGGEALVRAGPSPVQLEAAATTTTAPPPTTSLPPPPPPPPPPPLTAPPTLPPPTTSPPPPTVVAASAPVSQQARFTNDPYGGFGTWIDVYDWSATYGPNDGSHVTPADIDRMANLGVQTVYVQTSKWDAPADVLEPERLLPLIERAHARGMRVVAWYLPVFTDVAVDLRRLLAAADLPVDGLGVDIESLKVDDHAERSRRLVELSQALRNHLPGQAISAIVLPPVVMEVINPNYWPGFPWAELAPLYNVWMPMSYWTNRAPESGYRDGYRYTAENIDRLRTNIGQPGALVHTIGGIGDQSSSADIDGMVRAASERGCIGGSLYDYRTTGDGLWPGMQSFRR